MESYTVKAYILHVSGAEAQFDRQNNQGSELVRNWDISTSLCPCHFCMKPLTTLRDYSYIDRDGVKMITLWIRRCDENF